MKIFKSPTSIFNSLKYRYLKNYGTSRKFADYLYKRCFGRRINWENPEDLNQWINKIAFDSDTSNWPRLADKYGVRDYVIEKGFKDSLVHLLGRWETPDLLSFEDLPDRFVLKMNNGSGDVKIVENKNEENLNEIKDHFRKYFSIPFGKTSAEPHYLSIKPCIIAEELLEVSNQDIKSSSLIDYKFWCFNGRPVSCMVCKDRTKECFTLDLYTADENWIRIDDGNVNFDKQHLKATTPLPKPKQLNKMLGMVSELSKGLPQARIDLYNVGGKIYFGEITMTSFAGRMKYFSDAYLIKLGDECRRAVFELKDSINIKI